VLGQVTDAVEAGVAQAGLVGAALDLGQVVARAPLPHEPVELGPVPDPAVVVRVARVVG
jgi:hypothetical protein